MEKINIIKNGVYGKTKVIEYEFYGKYFVCMCEYDILNTHVYDTLEEADAYIEHDLGEWFDFEPKQVRKATKYTIGLSLAQVKYNIPCTANFKPEAIENGVSCNFTLAKIIVNERF